MRDPLRESRRPHRVREHPYAPWFAVGAVCVGAFMGQLDASIVTLAFPALRYLLPRTRQRGRGGRFDWPGLVLLAASTSALLLAASVLSGLDLPSWSVPVLLTAAAGAAIGFWRWEARVPSAPPRRPSWRRWRCSPPSPLRAGWWGRGAAPTLVGHDDRAKGPA